MRRIVHLCMGVVTGLIGLAPVQCQQQPAGPKVINQQQSGTGQPSAVQQQPVPNAYPSRPPGRRRRRSTRRWLPRAATGARQ